MELGGCGKRWVVFVCLIYDGWMDAVWFWRRKGFLVFGWCVWIYVSSALTFRELGVFFLLDFDEVCINCACNDTNHIHGSPALFLLFRRFLSAGKVENTRDARRD